MLLRKRHASYGHQQPRGYTRSLSMQFPSRERASPHPQSDPEVFSSLVGTVIPVENMVST